MSDPTDAVMDLIFGRWRSQTLYAGVELGVFEHLADGAGTAGEVAGALDLDPENTYCLLRALASLELLEERPDGAFALTERGEVLTDDHPRSLRGVALLERDPRGAPGPRRRTAVGREPPLRRGGAGTATS